MNANYVIDLQATVNLSYILWQMPIHDGRYKQNLFSRSPLMISTDQERRYLMYYRGRQLRTVMVASVQNPAPMTMITNAARVLIEDSNCFRYRKKRSMRHASGKTNAKIDDFKRKIITQKNTKTNP